MIRLLNILVLSLGLIACQGQSSAPRIETEDVKELMKDESVKMMDVRSESEVGSGYIGGTEYFFNVQDADFEENIATLDKDLTYIVYCRSGMRSTTALKYMEAQGFTNLYELKGGILNWSDAESILTK